MRRLDGEVALVTGSTSGLGHVIARRLCEEGASVVLTGRSAARGEAAVAAICDAEFVAADLTDEAACAALVDATVARFGRLTILVNNASLGGVRGSVAETDRATFENVLRVNFLAAATLCRLAVPHMLDAGHGSIVNVSAEAARLGTPDTAALAASKAALEALARSISADYASRGIRCNNVRPGYVLSDIRDAELTLRERAELEAMHLTRVPEAEDVAAAVAFLASRDAEVITGITLPVDGGASALRAHPV